MLTGSQNQLRGALIAATVPLALAAADSFADEIHVPGDYPTIQAAVDAAQDGDQVVLATTIFTGDGNRDVLVSGAGGRSITIRSVDPGDPGVVANTIVDCEALGRGFILTDGADGSLEGFTIRRGLASGGGGIRIESSSPLLYRMVVNACDSMGSGGGVSSQGGSPIFSDCDFTRNYAGSGGRGGAIYLVADVATVTPTIDACRIEWNESEQSGGGIYLEGVGPEARCDASLLDVALENNWSSVHGGGVAIGDHAAPVIQNPWIQLNTAVRNGGGIAALGANCRPVVTGGVIRENWAANGGGFSANSAEVALTGGCAVDQNLAWGWGGGIWASSGSLVIDSVTIDGNLAGGDGGGMLLSSVRLSLIATAITGNHADSTGGGIRVLGSSPETNIIDCVIDQNDAAGDGGGVCFASHAGGVVADSVITANRSNGRGGGLFLGDSGARLVRNCEISGNVARGFGGGGIYLGRDARDTVEECLISNNSAYNSSGDGGYGGGAAIFGADSAAGIHSCVLSGNTADVGGGGVYIRRSGALLECLEINGNQAAAGSGGAVYAEDTVDATMRSCIVSGNAALNGAGVYTASGTMTIEVCTIVNNTATNLGGGLYGATGGATTVDSVILWDSSPEQIHAESPAAVTARYCDVMGGWTGEGNIDADPRFAAVDDYHLTAGSPCINAGNPQYRPLPDLMDIDHQYRIGGRRVDIGADEYFAIALDDPAPGTAGAVNTFTVHDATPDAMVYFVYALRSGATQIPSCPGVYVDLSAPSIFGSTPADGNGNASVTEFVPGAVRGRTVFFQAVEAANCDVSNLTPFEFN